MSSCVVAVVSDLHINSKHGLFPPAGRDEGHPLGQSKMQAVTWGIWQQFWRKALEWKQRHNCSLIAVIDGEILDINKHDLADAMTRDLVSVLALGESVLGPVVDLADQTFIIKGTEAHEGAHSYFSGLMAERLSRRAKADIIRDDYEDQASWMQVWAEFGGVTFDIAHHPPTCGSRPWTIGAAAARSQAIIRSDYIEAGKQPPDIAIRGHRHIFRESGRDTKPFFIYCPSWSLKNAFVHRIGAATTPLKIGGLLFHCHDGVYEYEPVVGLWKGRGEPWRSN